MGISQLAHVISRLGNALQYRCVDQPVCSVVSSDRGSLWRVEGRGVVAEHCQLWQALWKWQIDYDTQQENVHKLALQSSGVNVLPVEGSTRLDP